MTEFDIIHRNVMHATSLPSANCSTTAIADTKNAPTRVARSKRRPIARLNDKLARLDTFPADASISSERTAACSMLCCLHFHVFMRSTVRQPDDRSSAQL